MRNNQPVTQRERSFPAEQRLISTTNSKGVITYVNEAFIGRVRTGTAVSAVLDAYPDWTIPAHVIAVVPTANREKATVKVRIALKRRDPRVLPDMAVKVRFLEAENAAASSSAAAVSTTK